MSNNAVAVEIRGILPANSGSAVFIGNGDKVFVIQVEHNMGSIIGMFPQVFVVVSLGAGLNEIIQKNVKVPSLIEILFSTEIYIPIIAFIILLIVGIIIKNIFYKN